MRLSLTSLVWHSALPYSTEIHKDVTTRQQHALRQLLSRGKHKLEENTKMINSILKKISSVFLPLLMCFAVDANAGKTIYVNNEEGSNNFNGLAKEAGKDGKSGPFASIGKLLQPYLLPTGSRLRIQANLIGKD